MMTIGRVNTKGTASPASGRAGGGASRPLAGMVMAVALGAVAVSGCGARAAQGATDQWVPAGESTVSRSDTLGVLLGDGSVLLAGGRSEADHGRLSDRFYPATGEWRPTGSMLVARVGHGSVRLADGRVLMSGGVNSELVERLRGGGDDAADGLLRATDVVSPSMAELYDPESGTFSATGTMVSGERWYHAAVLLSDGRVLVAGGWNLVEPLASAELYDPRTGTWRRTADMATPRNGPIYAVLPDGRVLVAGGTAVKTNDVSAMLGQTSVEAYDPATETWAPLGPTTDPRFWNSAVLLADGRVLVAGAVTLSGRAEDVYSTSEIYDPATDRWDRPVPMLYGADFGSGAALLADGRVLFVNGRASHAADATRAQVFDPQLGTWLDVAQPRAGDRWSAILTTLLDGRCLLAGGRIQTELFVPAGWQPPATPTATPSPIPSDTPTTAPTATETPSATPTVTLTPTPSDTPTITPTRTPTNTPTATPPAVGWWSAAGRMLHPRWNHSATLLQDGRVLVAGGTGGRNVPWGELPEESPTTAEIYDPATNSWSAAGEMAHARITHSALLLADGRVLVIGGYDPTRDPYFNVHEAFWPRPEVFDPASGVWSQLEIEVEGGHGTSHRLLPDGRVLLSGLVKVPHRSSCVGCWCVGGGETLADTLILDVASGESVAGPEMVVGRAAHWSAVLADGTVLLGGGVRDGAQDYHHIPGPTVCWLMNRPQTELEAFEPASGRLRRLADMPRPPRDLYGQSLRSGDHTRQLVLPDGRVLVSLLLERPLVYNPADDSWSDIDWRADERKHSVLALLADGKVLVMFGREAEVYDPVTDSWTWAGHANAVYMNWRSVLRPTATTLVDGRVLLVGGGDSNPNPAPTMPELLTFGARPAGRELYAPAVYAR